MERFDFQPTSITDLVSTRYFSVPRYQRSYAWQEDEITDFWNDLKKAIDDGGEYFFGNIVLTENADKKSFSIIDGQQRIATATILNAAIRDVYKQQGEFEIASAVRQEMICALDTESHEKVARIRLNEIDNPFYHEKFIEEKLPAPTCESHKLIVFAYEFFLNHLNDLIVQNPAGWKAEIGKISRFFKTQSKVVAVYAANDADAFTIFETLNDRGRDLTIADLLKNYLFSRSDNEIDVVQSRWIETKSILDEYIDEVELVTFLRHYWSSVYGSTREKELYRSIKDNIKSKAQAVRFSSDIKSAAKLYGASLSDKAEFWKSYSETDRNNVRLLLRLKLEQNRPLLLAIFQHFPKGEVQKSIPSLVSWSVRGLIGGVMGKGAAETTFCDAAKKIRAGTVKTRDELRLELSGLVPRDSQFANDFGRYRTTNNSFARYLLLGIERQRSGEKQPEYVPNENVDEINLEHILPRRANGTDWPNFTSDEVTFFSLRLGNMTLLKERANGKLGNKAFSIKQPVLQASKLKLNAGFAGLTSWDRKKIEDRQMDLSNDALKVWKL